MRESFADTDTPEGGVVSTVQYSRPYTGLESFWFMDKPDPHVSDADLIDRADPAKLHLDQLDQYRLARIVYTLARYAQRVPGKKQAAFAAWEKIQTPWYHAMENELAGADPQALATILWAFGELKPIRPDLFQTPPEAFRQELEKAVAAKGPYLNATDTSQILVGFGYFTSPPGESVLTALNNQAVRILKGGGKVDSNHLTNISFGFSNLHVDMSDDLADALADRARVLIPSSFLNNELSNLAGNYARLSRPFSPKLAESFYPVVSEKWDSFRNDKKARVLWATAVFSVLKPLPKAAFDFLADISNPTLWDSLDLRNAKVPSAATALFRLAPEAAREDWERLGVAQPLANDLWWRLKNANLVVEWRNGYPAVQTQNGDVVIQGDNYNHYIRDAKGNDLRRKGGILLASALLCDHYNKPVLRLSPRNLHAVSDEKLSEAIAEIARKPKGVYEMSGAMVKDLKIEPRPVLTPLLRTDALTSTYG